jgi:hypothetical protein
MLVSAVGFSGPAAVNALPSIYERNLPHDPN